MTERFHRRRRDRRNVGVLTSGRGRQNQLRAIVRQQGCGPISLDTKLNEGLQGVEVHRLTCSARLGLQAVQMKTHGGVCPFQVLTEYSMVSLVDRRFPVQPAALGDSAVKLSGLVWRKSRKHLRAVPGSKDVAPVPLAQ